MMPLLQDDIDRDEEIEAMRNQFNVLHKTQIHRQSSNQFLLRMTSNEDTPQTDDNDQKYNYDNTSDKHVKVDADDVSAMKDAFDKQQKVLLNRQIEKALRIPETIKDDEDDKDNKNNKDDDEFNDNNNINLCDIDQETEEKLVEDTADMKNQFQELNKMMIRYRSTKNMEIGMVPQIKPQHKEQFIRLMKDIGIVNEHIMDKLWMNIEKTVNDDNDNDKEEIDPDIIEYTNTIEKLQKENESLRQQIKQQEE